MAAETRVVRRWAGGRPGEEEDWGWGTRYVRSIRWEKTLSVDALLCEVERRGHTSSSRASMSLRKPGQVSLRPQGQIWAGRRVWG